MRRYIVVVVCAMGLFLGAKTSQASNYAVGTCRPNLASFNTISEAVAGVPSGATILVCPGTYSEQVTISTPLTLEGVSSGDSDRVIIVPPAGGLVANTSATIQGITESVAAQILVTTGPVNISNITVDGTGNNVVSEIEFTGIFYGSGSSGTVSQVTARNEVNLGNGNGLWAENDTTTPQSVTFENCSFYNIDDVAIALVNSQNPSTLTATVKSNNISNVLNGIAIFGAAGTVSGNFVTDMVTFTYGESTNMGFAGIVALSTGAPIASITDNTVTDSVAFGLAAVLNTTGVAFKSNTVINAAEGGIAVAPATPGVSGTTIQTNKIVGGPTGTIGIEFDCSTATVSGNAISNATTGLNDVPLGFTPGANTFYDVDSIENQMNCTSSDVMASAMRPAAKALRAVKPTLPLVLKVTRPNG